MLNYFVDSSFIKRIITALFLFVLFFYCLFKLSVVFFELITLCVLIFAIVEWSILIGLKGWVNKGLYITFLFVVGYLIVLFDINIKTLLFINFFVWIIGFFCICFYSKLRILYKNFVLGVFFGLFIFVPWWFSINYLNIVSSFYKMDLLFVCCLVFGADIFAYFFGKHLGKKRLSFKISPGKTWMGLFGMLVSTFLIVFMGFFVLRVFTVNLYAYIFFSFVLVFLSVIGDLVESSFKREVNLKNSGFILPGHGGILDRIDSLLPVIPMFIFLFKF